MGKQTILLKAKRVRFKMLEYKRTKETINVLAVRKRSKKKRLVKLHRLIMKNCNNAGSNKNKRYCKHLFSEVGNASRLRNGSTAS